MYKVHLAVAYTAEEVEYKWLEGNRATHLDKKTNKQNTEVMSMRDIKIKSYLRISSLAGGRVCSRHPYWTTLQQKIF